MLTAHFLTIFSIVCTLLACVATILPTSPIGVGR